MKWGEWMRVTAMACFATACAAQTVDGDGPMRIEQPAYALPACPAAQLPEWPMTCRPFKQRITVPDPKLRGQLSAEGDPRITQGCQPAFEVKHEAGAPMGQAIVVFEGATPFVDERSGEPVWAFRAVHAGQLRARLWCERVCTDEQPCKYSVIYLGTDGRSPFPVLDPPIIIEQ